MSEVNECVGGTTYLLAVAAREAGGIDFQTTGDILRFDCDRSFGALGKRWWRYNRKLRVRRSDQENCTIDYSQPTKVNKAHCRVILDFQLSFSIRILLRILVFI